MFSKQGRPLLLDKVTASSTNTHLPLNDFIALAKGHSYTLQFKALAIKEQDKRTYHKYQNVSLQPCFRLAQTELCDTVINACHLERYNNPNSIETLTDLN